MGAHQRQRQPSGIGAATETEEFYDALAAEYHLLFPDWWAAAQWHGEVIAGVLAARGVRPPATVLDCTCGVGTQALPLAALGYRMTGTDLSRRAVERARREARIRGLPVTLGCADVRDLRAAVTGTFEAVVSCDNSLPHLLTDPDLERAVDGIRTCLVDGGVLVASIRDYDDLRRTRPAGVPIALHGPPGSRHGAGQSWRWSEDAEHLDITLFTFQERAAGDWAVSAHETRYRTLRRDRLSHVLTRRGFASAEWLLPEQSGYYQPLVVALANRTSPPAEEPLP
ncbi:class I SAM-dependent DNA methyltransferase [Geodermatophilus maliterrae]|uniref:Class I SAM-dependent methyltransferase n=1 Tax=Geodermatophilus maliterrae TaxID=3162531 RepID=A0ABV3XD27_9ACTN